MFFHLIIVMLCLGHACPHTSLWRAALNASQNTGCEVILQAKNVEAITSLPPSLYIFVGIVSICIKGVQACVCVCGFISILIYHHNFVKCAKMDSEIDLYLQLASYFETLSVPNAGFHHICGNLSLTFIL